jgi:hypothetical protein
MEWKVIKEPYYISDMGEIKNMITGRILKQQMNDRGYQVVRVTIDRKKYTFRPHREVAKAFIPNPDNKPQVNHINGNKSDNRVANLEWCTNKENADHAIKNGLWNNVFKASRDNNEKRKKRIKAINIETNEEKIYESISEAEKDIGSRHITDVLKGKRTHAKGYKFFYLRG